MPVYHLNGKSYNIPDEVVAKFEKDNPEATVNYQANGKTYGIPISKRDGFLQKYPDAVLESQQPAKKQSLQQPQAPVEQLQQQETQSQQGYTPTEQDMMRWGMAIGSAQSTLDQTQKTVEDIQKMDMTPKLGGIIAGIGSNSNLRKGPKSFNAETGQFEDTYTTTDGKSHANIVEASNMQDFLDYQADMLKFKENMEAIGLGDITGQKDKSNAQQLEDAKNELEYLNVLIDKENRKGLGIRFKSDPVLGMIEDADASGNQDLFNLLSAKRLLERRITALEAERDDPSLLQGTWDVLKDPSNYTFGLTDLDDAKNLEGIKKKIGAAGNGIPNLTESEKLLARHYLMNQEAQALNENRDWWYGAGQGLGQTLSFMKDFALTGGGFVRFAKMGMRMGTKAGLKYAASDMAQYITKNLGVAGNVLNKTLQYGAKFGGLAAGAEVSGLALANTAQLASTFANINNRNIGTLSIDDEGKLAFKDSEDLVKAILFEELKASGENASEMVGPAFDLLPGLLGRVIRNKIGGEALKKLVSNKYWRKGEKTLDWLGVQGVFGEGMEEEYGMLRTEILNKITGNQFDPNAEGITDLDTQLNTWATVGLTSVALRVPQMVATGVDKAQYYGYKYNLNQSDKRLRAALGDDARYDSIKAMLDGATNMNIGNTINSLVRGAELSDQEKEAVMYYAQDLINLRGFNIGNVLAASRTADIVPKVASYQIKADGRSFDELDEKGNVISHHEYENNDEMKAGLYEAQQQRFDNDLYSDMSVMKARPDGQYDRLVEDFLLQSQSDMLPSDLEAILEKPSLKRTDAEQQVATQFAKLLHETVYDNTMLHEEQSAQDGSNAADTAAIDMNNPNSQELQEANAAWIEAQGNRRMAFDANESLKDEVLNMEEQGLSHQEIISRLETFSPQEQQTIIDYYNQKARFEAMVNKVNAKIDEEAHNQRERHTMKGTINGGADVGNVYTITDGTNTYFLVSGNITTDPSTGQITGSDSGLIIGMDLDGSFVNISDTSGYRVENPAMTLDQYEAAEKDRLQQLWTVAIDPDGTMVQQPQEESGAAEGEAGATTDIGANEPSVSAPSEEQQQEAFTPIENVIDKEGIKRYENGIEVDDAIADIEADGFDVNEVADASIAEAQQTIENINKKQTKTRKDLADRKTAQDVIDYYSKLKARYNELHPVYADAAPFIAQLKSATSRKKADEILNAALQAGVNPEEIQPVHTQKISDLITKEEEDRRKAEEITDRDLMLISQWNGTPEGRAWLLDRKRVPSAEKRRKIAKLIYGDLFDDDFEAWRDLPELISMWLGKGRTLDPDTFGQELGWDMSVGKDAAKVSTMFAARPENGGDGMTWASFVHMVMEASNGRFDTEEVGRTLEEMFRSAQEKSDLTEYQLTSRITEAEKTLASEEQQAIEAEEEEDPKQEEQPINEGQLPFAPANEEEPKPAFIEEEEAKPEKSEREQYLESHPLTEEQIMADIEANEDEKLAAIEYLKGEDESGISQFYYDQIYERSQKQKSIDTEDPMEAIGQASLSFRERQKKEENEPAKEKKEERSEQKSQDQKDIDDALKEFNDFLDNAKGDGVLDKFMHKGLEKNDKAQINIITLLTGTNAAQQAFMKDLLRLGTKVGYAYIKSGIHDFQAWSTKMSETIGKKLKEVLNWEDGLIGEFMTELWNQKYTVDGERLRLSEHAEKLKNNKGADTTVNVNKQEDNVSENDVNLQQKDDLQGDSAEFADRQAKIERLRNVITDKLRSICNDGYPVKPLSEYKKFLKQVGIKDMSDTDLQEIIEACVVDLAREFASNDLWSEERKFNKIVKLYQSQPSLNARDNDRINKQQYSTAAPMAYLMGRFVDPGHKAKSGLEPSAGNGMLTIALPKTIMHVNDIDEMRLSNLQKQGFGQVTSQDGTQPFDGKYDVVVTNPPFGSVLPKVYDGIYEISALEHQMAINALESMKDNGRAAIIIGGNTDYRANGAVQGKDRVFLNYLYSHYNVVDVINMDGKALYSRQGTGFPLRMILIDGRKEFDPKSFAPVKSKARAEQVKTYEELYNRVNNDILSDSNKPASVHDTESGKSGRVDDTSNAGASTQTGVRNVRTGGSSKQHSVLAPNGSSVQRGNSTTDKGTDTESQPVVDTRPTGVGSRTETSQPSRPTAERTDIGRGERETSDGRDGSQRPNGGVDVPVGGGSRTSVEVRRLGAEKVPYRQQSTNPYSLQSQMPAEQADVVKKALEELGDVDEFLVKELGYSSVEDLHHGSQSPEKHGGLAAEQVDSVAMAIHQMNQGNAFIIGDQTGIGKGRQAAALIRYGVKKGGCPVFISVKKGLFSDMYRDLCDIGSPELKPFIWSADDDEHSADITDKNGNVVYKRPSDKEQKRVVEYINKNGKLPPEYDYIVTTYDSFKGGTMTYEDGKKQPRKFAKGKSATTGAINSQSKRDALERLAESSYVIMDESHNAGGETSAVSGYLQYITTKAKGVTFLSATFAKRPGNMPIYSLKTAISKAGVSVGELIDAVKRGGATFQEIMSKALTEAGQMIRRERNMEGVTIDWRGIEDEDVIQKQREQYDTIIGLFNDIISFQRAYVDPIVNGMNDAAAEEQGEVDHTPGTRDMGINNTPFASRTYNMVQQVLLSLKAEEAAKRAIEHLKLGRKPVITVANTNEGAADEAAGMGEAMEMPDLSVNLKKGLQGTLRITKKDAFGNTVNEMIPFDRLSEEGRKRYQEIMDAIENASSGLSLSPIDVIKNELKKAGYKVGELTGRKAEFVYNEDGTVNRVKRQDTDKKRIAADFNNGNLDALILNRSAGTGISLHASSTFKDQRQRIMIVAQAQGDVNDEVQIRGRIDRTGQVLRGMYEYVVSQIPSEQRLLMMLKAKLRSLDANTTSSQKSKFNEMQVQDIINKYGDDIVIQYLAEHPDLAMKMCDPLKWGEGAETLPAETLVSQAQKAQGDGATASKVLGRMALLTVKEQEKMLQEVGELYQAEIDRLNEMGENDLEITEMPLRAKTMKKDVWEEGVEPGGKNPFADNSYVEEVEMDVLKKPMKAEEVKKSQERLLGGKTWDEYKQSVLDRVDAWAENKKAETTKTITERAEKKATAEKEKYAKGAKKAQEKNGMTDEEIERNAGYQYDTFYKQEMEKLQNALDAVDKQKQTFVDAFETFTTDGVYALPKDIYDLSQLTFDPSFGKVIDIKITDNYSTNASTITFATLDGRRKITIPINGMVKQNNGEKENIKPTIIQQTSQSRSGFFGSNVANMLKVLEQDIDNWDKLASTATRKKGYIITGNLLKALTSLRNQGKGGKLISYTTDTGEVRQGILMSDQFDPGTLTSKNPISSAKDQITSGDRVTSADGDVTIDKGYYGRYELKVPKSNKRGSKYFNDEVLLSLMRGQFEGSSQMKATFDSDNLDAVLKRLDELGVTVEEEHNEKSDARISSIDPIKAIKQAADSWSQSKRPYSENKSTNDAKEIAKRIYDLPKKFGFKGAAITQVIGSRDELEALRGKVNSRVFDAIEESYNDPNTAGVYLPRWKMVVIFSEKVKDAEDGEQTWWHEQTHHFWHSLPDGLKDKYGSECLEYLKAHAPEVYQNIKDDYKISEWKNEACSYLIEMVVKKLGTEKFLATDFASNEIIRNFATGLKKFIRNGKQQERETGNRPGDAGSFGRKDNASRRSDLRGRDNQQEESGTEEVNRRITNPLDAIRNAAEEWHKDREEMVEGVREIGEYSAKEVYHDRIDRAESVMTEALQDDMVTFKNGQNAIAHDKEIPDSQNAYQASNLSYGKTYNEQERFTNVQRRAVEETVLEICNKMGWQTGDMDRYLFTKHGFERNRVLFVRDRLKAERNKTVGYNDLSAAGQDLYDRTAAIIEQQFEDGDITEEQKEKKLIQLLEKIHQDEMDALESGFVEVMQNNYEKLLKDEITFPEYLAALDDYIKANFDSKFDANNHDYSGFTEMFGDEEGNFDEAAILADLMEQEGKMGGELQKRLWSQINDVSQLGLVKYKDTGMMSEDTYKRVTNMFHWYVPMRGFTESESAQDHWQYMTVKDGAGKVGGLLKYAAGRKSEANYPLATLFAMTYKAISDGNQNIVKQHFYRLCQANPNDLVMINDTWAVLDESTGEWIISYPDIDSDMSPQLVEQKTIEHTKRMKQLEAEGKAKKVKSGSRFDYKVDKQRQREHIVEVMINGTRKQMVVTGNPRMAQAINGQLRYKGGKGKLNEYIANVKQFMQTMSTSYNLTFLGRNMARDWTHFGAILAVREGMGYEFAAKKYYIEQLPHMVSMFKKYRENSLDMNNEMERDFKDFMDNGGITGFVQMKKVEELQKEIQSLLSSQGRIKKVGNDFIDKTLGAVEAMNEAIENNARFATYRASRHYAGRSKARSAYDAKEVTVNFNKKGAGRNTAGFKSEKESVRRAATISGEVSQILMANKMFFNATVQAICNIFRGLRNKDGSINMKYAERLLALYAAPPFAMGMLMPVINQMLWELAGGGDDDDPYANLPEWVRRKNLCVYTGWATGNKNDFLVLPMGQELAAFYSLGDMIAGETLFPNLKPVDKSIADEVVGFFNVFSPVDFENKVSNENAPVSEFVGRICSPLAPIVAIGENVGWTGRPIFRQDGFPGDEFRPEYQMTLGNTNSAYVNLSKWLNDISGGDDVKRGWAQVNPSAMQYLFEQYTGGPGKFFMNTGSAVGDAYEMAFGEEKPDFNIRKIEFVRAFWQQGDERTDLYRAKAKYRKYRDEANEKYEAIKGYESDAATNPDHYMKLQLETRGKDYQRMLIVRDAEKTLKKLNTAANQLEGQKRENARAIYNQVLAKTVSELDKLNDVE